METSSNITQAFEIVIISMLSELTVTENYTGLQSINSISVVKFQVGSK